jgi:hypothetical protein
MLNPVLTFPAEFPKTLISLPDEFLATDTLPRARRRLRNLPRRHPGRKSSTGCPNPPRRKIPFAAAASSPRPRPPNQKPNRRRRNDDDTFFRGGLIKPVYGTVSRVTVDKEGSPRYVILYFKESPDGTFTAFSPNPEMLRSRYDYDFSGLIGKRIYVKGEVRPFRDAKGSVLITDPGQIEVR